MEMMQNLAVTFNGFPIKLALFFLWGEAFIMNRHRIRQTERQIGSQTDE